MLPIISKCDECRSEFFAQVSPLPQLCPECASVLYGYANCQHVFENGRCKHCYWNGKSSAYVQKLKNQQS
ncbi:hypothetical protein [Flexibacter flexilis]|uniref:hypothetical protein n=1 Tax=Flexibacter flexilis TaxID=998 RepID=UPI000B831514|nr:hypothetical protein [Flexibacter flexilis]